MEIFDTFDAEQLHSLFREAETLYSTGILPLDARLREIAKRKYGQDSCVTMGYAADDLYRYLAREYMASRSTP